MKGMMEPTFGGVDTQSGAISDERWGASPLSLNAPADRDSLRERFGSTKDRTESQ